MLPPGTTAGAFLAVNPDLNHVVITDYQSTFTNK